MAIETVSNHNLDGFEALICWGDTPATESKLVEPLSKLDTVCHLETSLLVSSNSLVIFPQYGWVIVTASELTNQLKIKPSRFSVAQNSKAIYLPMLPLIGYTKVINRVSKKTRNVGSFQNSGMLEQVRKTSIPYELTFTGVYNRESFTYEKLVIPAAETDKEIKLALLYPFGKLRILQGTITNYQEIGDLSENVLKTNWNFQGREITTYLA